MDPASNELGTGHGQLQIVGTPSANAGWAMETSLDVEWAHAIAPQANIMLVVAANTSDAALMGAVQTAANSGRKRGVNELGRLGIRG